MFRNSKARKPWTFSPWSFTGWQAILMLAVAMVAPRVRAYEGIDPNLLRKNIGQTIEDARKYINDPINLQGYVYDNLRVVGDDPRVLDFYGEVIRKSTNSLSMNHTLSALNSISEFYLQDKKRVRQIERISQEAARKGDGLVQIDSYKVIDGLSNADKRYREEAHKGYRRILSAKHPLEGDKKHKDNCVMVVQALLQSSPLDIHDIEAIKDATNRMDLLVYFKTEWLPLFSPRDAGQRVLAGWLGVLNAKKQVAP